MSYLDSQSVQVFKPYTALTSPNQAAQWRLPGESKCPGIQLLHSSITSGCTAWVTWTVRAFRCSNLTQLWHHQHQTAVLYIFEHLIGQDVLEPYFNRTWCLDDAKTIGHQTFRKKKSVVVNKTWKVEIRVTDHQSWNSCQKVVCDHEVTFSSASQPTKPDVLWPCTVYT